MVEVHLDLVGGRRDRLRARVLELVDEVLVALLGEPATLLRVEVDILDVEGGRNELEALDAASRRSAAALRERLRGEVGSAHPLCVSVSVAAVVVLLEVHVDADLVVLQSDERHSQARVAAEPELERDVQRLHRRARTGDARVRQLRRRARRIQRDTVGRLEENQVGGVAEHVLEGLLRARGLRELRPDLHPVAVLAVDARAAHLNLNLLDEAVADIVEPAEAVRRARVENNLRERDLDVRAVH